jgi:exopolysaccharide biosynthesis predicted pyruvyltransferase EpsI
MKSSVRIAAQASPTMDAALSHSAVPAGLLPALAERINAVLQQVIPADQPCALLDHPDHSNVGDSAIWLGERRFLRSQRIKVAYTCSVKTFDAAALRAAMPRGTVLIHGGGNFGTLWPHHQQLREWALEQLRDYRIVQLPQSIHYEDAAALRNTAQLIRAHPAFTLLVRDQNSLRIGRDELEAHTLLCPDAALLLAGTVRRRPAEVDCLVLARTDKERAAGGLEAACQGLGMRVAALDWLDEPLGVLHRIRNRLVARSRSSWAGMAAFQAPMLWIWDRLASQRTERGCRLLSRGRIVITDRLHAHILCTLLGIPHVVLDNNCGKLSGFMRCWTAEHPLCHLADSVEEATRIAQRLLASPSTS